MNNDLENLYGNNNEPNIQNNSINNNINTKKEPFNNSIEKQAGDLSSLYSSNINEHTEGNNSEAINNISLNQEGINKMYNQDTTDLEKEPLEKGKGPTIINNESSEIKNMKPERITDDDLLEAYVGKNFVKIATHPFNFAAFFFNAVYLFFRKKLLYGLIVFIIDMILTRFINSSLVGIGLAIITGTLFNRLYIKEAKIHIEEIKRKNSNKSNVEIREICKKQGGTSIIYIIIGIIISFIVGLVVGMVMIKLGYSNKSSSFNFDKSIFNNKNDSVYLGEVEKDKNIDIEKVYNVVVPEGFVKASTDKYELIYRQDNCSFNIYKSLDNKDIKKLTKEMSIYYLSYEDIKKSTINNINWYWIENVNGDEIEYHYVTSNNNNIYILEYTAKEKDKNCKNSKDKLLNNISTK